MPRKPPPDQDERDQMVALYRSGIGLEPIAKQIGRSTRTLRAVLDEEMSELERKEIISRNVSRGAKDGWKKARKIAAGGISFNESFARVFMRPWGSA